MSKRRKEGKWVRLVPNAGFVCESNRLLARILPEPQRGKTDWATCLNDCGDEYCREWVNLETEPDSMNNDEVYYLCHVSECEMLDIDGVALAKQEQDRERVAQLARGEE